MTYSEFSYEVLNNENEPPAEIAGYRSARKDGWGILTRGEMAHSAAGWKVNISVAPGDIDKAWDTLVELIMKHGIAQAQVANRETMLTHAQTESHQQGKMITLFDEPSLEHNWGKILHEMEVALREANIRRGPQPNGYRPVTGSAYFSRKNDKGITGGPVHDSISRPAEKEHNPGMHDDPFKDIDFSTIDIKAPAALVPRPGHASRGTVTRRGDDGTLHTRLADGSTKVTEPPKQAGGLRSLLERWRGGGGNSRA